MSPLRSMVDVQYYWYFQTIATSTATSRLYAPESALMTSADAALFAFDRLEQLALVTCYMPYRRAIFSAASGHTTWFGSNPARIAIAYE